MHHEIDWPPQYTIKASKRARHINLTIHPYRGLHITVPQHYDMSQLTTVLNDKRRWIEKNLQQIKKDHDNYHPKQLPQTLALQAINENWQVAYTHSNQSARLITLPNHCIGIYGEINFQTVKTLLHKWLLQHAKLHLYPWIQQISTKTQLDYQNLQMRGQKTRWGSCSHDGNITLNYKLLFLPPEWVSHIMLHELCHTVHLNHSQQFWQLVAKYDENWQQYAKAVRNATHMVPTWLEA